MIRVVRPVLVLLALGVAGCGRRPAAPPAAEKPSLRKVVLQTDWFPQAEHGGFYQALARGFYAEAGLEVEIRSGGPGVQIKVPVAKGDVDFGLNRSDDVIVQASRGLPLMMVAAVFQHDPQALMVHADSPVKSLADLNGRTVIANVGLAWIPYVQQKYRIKFNLRPNTYGLAAFLGAPEAIQQCIVTNEPYFAERAGVRVRTLPLADSGWDCYHALICGRELVRRAPEMVGAFVAASIRGWRDYLDGDPAPGNNLILDRNNSLTLALLQYSRDEMILRSLVHGDRTKGEDIGQLSLARLLQEEQALIEMRVIDVAVPISEIATKAFLPATQR